MRADPHTLLVAEPTGAMVEPPVELDLADALWSTLDDPHIALEEGR